MSEQPGPNPAIPDAATLSANLTRVASQSQQILADFLRQQGETGEQSADPLNIGTAFAEMLQKMAADPQRLFEAQMQLWQQYLQVWNNAALRFLGQDVAPAVPTPPGDKRFKNPAWNDGTVFDFIKQSYLLTADWMQKTVHDVEGLDPQTRQKVRFYTRQFADALSPSNFVLTNPEVLKATVESNGENLVKGLQNLLTDLERGKGRLAISMTAPDAFVVGRNLATTPGKVVFQNELLQLIQYTPTTDEVYERPLLIVPPWINKFYILDLRQDNSFIRWAVSQGYTVFVVSWVNPDERLTGKTFDDYMVDGLLAAVGAACAASGTKDVSAIGYCIGGTLMAATLAYLAATGDERIKACTFFTAQVDFADAGELQVFVDEEQLKNLERLMAKRGYLEGSEMFTTFNMLRANDLIWSFVVNNYLLGKDPFPFDLLFWNADSTRMPARLHSYYLRNMYQRNLLAQPGGLTVRDVPLDLGRVTIPIYMQAGRDDHIAPARSVYKATQLFGGPVRFMLAGSGHVAGVVNPPAAKKYQHWLNDTKKNPATLEEWQAAASEHPGSWWTDWNKWLSKLAGKKVPARVPGSGKLKAIEDAPGSYVLVRSDK
jgi:polyhydroxyalkanoate synthase